MQSPQFVEELQNVRSFNERVIVIGKYAPRHRSVGVLMQDLQQRQGEIIHALGRVADVVCVFVASRGEEEVKMAKVRTVRWGVPGTVVLLAPREDLLALLRCKPSPKIWVRHTGSSR